MSPIIFVLDLAVVAVLALCVWRGAAKGLVLTLCGLAAIVVAFLGAGWISNQFSEPVGEFIRPYVSDYLEDLVESAVSDVSNLVPSESPSLPIFSQPGSEEELLTPEIQATLSEILSALDDSGMFSGVLDAVKEAVEEDVGSAVSDAVGSVSDLLSYHLARLGLFFLSFFLILIVWWLVSHMLDLAFHLPILSTVNTVGGGVIGFIKGVLVLLVAAWALVTFDIVPPGIAHQTVLFDLFLNFQII